MGFAAGFQVGASAVERGLKMREEDELKRNLAQAYAKPEEFTDYTPEQQQQIQGLQAAGGYDVQAVPGAEGQAPTLRYTARQGSGYLNEQGMPEAPIEIAPQRVQRYGGQTVAGQFDPTQLQGLQTREAARVIGASGDPVRASQLLAEANRLDREAKEAPLRFKGLEQQVALGAQSLETGTLTLAEKKRASEATSRMDAFNTEFNNLDNPTPDQIKSLASKFNLDRAQQLDVTSQITGIAKNELAAFDMDIQKSVRGKDLSGLLDLHKTDKRFSDGTHFVMGKGDKGQVILNLVSDSDPTKVLRTESFKDSALATAYLRKAAEDPANLAEWMLGMRGKEVDIKSKEASIQASNSLIGLRGMQVQSMRELSANSAQRADIVEKFQDLTEEEQNGAKGQGLLKQFNLLNVKSGAMVPLGAAPKTGGRTYEMTDVDKENLKHYREWAKDSKNAKLPQGQKDAYAAELGVSEFIKRGATGPSSGVGSNPYAVPQGVDTNRAPAPAARPAPAALSVDNTKVLGRAGNTGYNVQLPDGTTQVMSISQLNKLGHQFPNGTGLKPAWYEDLLPRR